MRKLTMAACAAGRAIALGTGMASAAQASSVIVVGPGHSIQAAINAARPGDTVFVRPGVYHQSVQIRKNGITLRGSGAFHGGTVLVPPKHIPKTLCNTGSARRAYASWRSASTPRPARCSCPSATTR
jgi:pectin methylesterase-like acyl-CoA thioesterase